MRLPVLIIVLLSVLLSWCSPLQALEIFNFDFPQLFGKAPQESVAIEDLEPFLDEFFAREMARLNIPGAVFSMVEHGELIFSKGYGFADLASKRPVDPEKTLFRVASISKVVTATAVMQLSEQGLLDLHEDINVYLDGFLPAGGFAAPVTTAHLLTHTAGFDDRSVNLAFNRADRVPSLEEYLARNLPPRVMAPGEMISYSNHGSGLAGLVVEKISGKPFADYARVNILEPLGMENSSFLLPPELAPNLATGYFSAGGYNQPRAFDYLSNIAPAASLNATAADMARFMLAHLEGGRVEGNRILQEATVEEMQAQQFTHHPELAGVTYGFFERYANNRRFIHHSGLWGGFASLLFLYPEGNLGFFVSLNSGAGVEVHGNLAAEFVNRFLLAPEESNENVENSAAAALTDAEPFESQADACTGSYRPVRYSRRSLEKIAVLAAQCQTTDLGNGGISLEFSSQSGREPIRWAESEPFFFREAGGEDGLAFRQDEQGRVTHLFWGPVAMERLAWYEGAALHRAAGITFLGLFLSAWAGWPLLWAYRGRRKPGIRGGWQGLRAAAAAALLYSVFSAGIIYYLVFRPETLIYGIPPVLAVLLVLPLPAGALTLSAVWTAARSWKVRYWTLAGRIHYSLVVLSLVLFIPFLHYWNLLGLRF